MSRESKLLKATIQVANEAELHFPAKSYFECNNFSTAVVILAKEIGLDAELYSVPMRFERDLGEFEKGDVENHTYFRLGSRYYDFTLSQFGMDNKAYAIRTSPYPNSKKNPKQADSDGYKFWYDKIKRKLNKTEATSMTMGITIRNKFLPELTHVWNEAKREANDMSTYEDWWDNEERDPTEKEIEQFIRKQFYAFIDDITQHAVVTPKGLVGYRFLSGKQLNKGQLDTKNVGIYWAYHKSGSEHYKRAWGDGHENDYWLEALIPWSSVDIKETLRLGLHPSARHINERELRLKQNSPITLTKINGKDVKKKATAQTIQSWRTTILSRYKVKFLFKVEAAVSVMHVEQSIRKFLDKFFKEYNLPIPHIKIVNNLNAKWLGRTSYTPAFDKDNSTIEIQKSITDDEKTLDRVIAHELIHHWDYMTRFAHPQEGTKNWEMYQKRHKLGFKQEGHGKEFHDWAAKINAVMGKDYVTETSDTSYVQQIDKDYFVLITEISPEKFGWSWAARPSTIQKEVMKTKILNGKSKLFSTRDSRFLAGAKIKKYGPISVPRDKETMEKLKDMFNSGKDIHL